MAQLVRAVRYRPRCQGFESASSQIYFIYFAQRFDTFPLCQSKLHMQDQHSPFVCFYYVLKANGVQRIALLSLALYFPATY